MTFTRWRGLLVGLICLVCLNVMVACSSREPISPEEQATTRDHHEEYREESGLQD